jgi:hypothetical protein
MNWETYFHSHFKTSIKSIFLEAYTSEWGRGINQFLCVIINCLHPENNSPEMDYFRLFHSIMLKKATAETLSGKLFLFYYQILPSDAINAKLFCLQLNLSAPLL